MAIKVGDHVRWNAEAGLVSGKIIRTHNKDTRYKGYTHHASEGSVAPQPSDGYSEADFFAPSVEADINSP